MKSMKTQIDGVEVEIIKFNPFKGGVLLGQTTKLFAPIIKDLVSATQGKLSEAEQLDIFITALQDLFTTNTPDEVMAYLKELLASGYVVVKKQKIQDIDDLENLCGDDNDSLMFMLLLASESIKYNFAGMLKKLVPPNG